MPNFIKVISEVLKFIIRPRGNTFDSFEPLEKIRIDRWHHWQFKMRNIISRDEIKLNQRPEGGHEVDLEPFAVGSPLPESLVHSCLGIYLVMNVDGQHQSALIGTGGVDFSKTVKRVLCPANFDAAA